MATVIDELMIKLGLDGSGAKKGMKDAENNIKGSMKNITSTLQGGLSSVSKIFTGFGAALVGAFSVGSAFSTWKEQATELGAVSRRLKMSMEDVQGWTGAIGKFGGTAQDFEGTLRGLNGQLAKMATIGKSRTGTLLQSLGIDAGEVGRQRNALEVLEELSGVMEQMAPDEARGIGAALGLDASTIMLLQQGREGMRDLIREKRESAVYTQEDADAVKAYNVEMGKLKKGFMGIMGVLFRSIMPAFTLVTKYVAQFVNFLRKHQTAVKAFFVMISALVMGLLLPSLLAFFSALMTNPMTWVILALVALAAVIEDLIVWMDGGESALDRFWEALFGDRENAKRVFEEIKESLVSFWERLKFVFNYIASGKAWQDMKDHANTAINLIRDRWNILVRNFKQRIEELKTKVKEPFVRMGEAIDRMIERVTQFCEEVNAYWEELNRSIGDKIDWIKQTANELWETIKQKCAEAMAWAEAKWEEMKTTATSALNSLLEPIQSIASWIYEYIGGAIDWALEKWNALKSIVGGGEVFVNHDLTAAYAGAAINGGGTTTNTTNYYDYGGFTYNGSASGRQAGLDLRNAVVNANGGLRK
jgi:hypothetical protein